MSKFERALSSYLTSTRHCPGVGADTRTIHARRKALLRNGKIDQAAAIRRARERSS